jgi:hypothetical protein
MSISIDPLCYNQFSEINFNFSSIYAYIFQVIPFLQIFRLQIFMQF